METGLNWFELLPKTITNYNNSYHSTIKMTPHEAYNLAPENEGFIFDKQIQQAAKMIDDQNEDLEVGDYVRKLKVDRYSQASNFSSTTHANWSNSVFRVEDIKKREVVPMKRRYREIVEEARSKHNLQTTVYILSGDNGYLILTSDSRPRYFFRHELRRVDYNPRHHKRRGNANLKSNVKKTSIFDGEETVKEVPIKQEKIKEEPPVKELPKEIEIPIEEEPTPEIKKQIKKKTKQIVQGQIEPRRSSRLAEKENIILKKEIIPMSKRR
jgi:hypothetical protein